MSLLLGLYQGTTTDARLLEVVGRFHFVTAEQATRLLYRRGSLTYVRDRLRRLAEGRYLHRVLLPRTSTGGSSPHVYTLTQRGATSLSTLQPRLATRFRPSEHREHSYLFLKHTLVVNDVLIAAHHLVQRVPGIRLADCRHERDLRRQPTRVRLDRGQAITVIPDGYLDIRLHDRVQMCFTLEVDRGTVEARAFRRKIAALLAYALGPYRSLFDTQSLTITFVIDGDDRRLSNVVTWTEQELLRSGKQRYADLFRFTRLSPEIDPVRLFCTPQWFRPFHRQPLPLLSPLIEG